MLAIKNILVPFDWSELSKQAFQLAASLARENDAEVVVLYVVPVPVECYGPAPENYLSHLLKELSQLRPDDSGTRVSCHVLEGEPAACILGAAGDYHCDLIVMGTHGRTGLRRFLRRSVAEEVVRKAPCLVLTVRGAMASPPVSAARGATSR
jgi:nucleotide-binding universal stress UspA family protein